MNKPRHRKHTATVAGTLTGGSTARQPTTRGPFGVEYYSEMSQSWIRLPLTRTDRDAAIGTCKHLETLDLQARIIEPKEVQHESQLELSGL